VAVLSKLTLDVTALRRSRDYRVVEIGAIVSGLGNQAALVAVPWQVYIQTHSTALVGLIGAAELGPTIAVALFGGALADRLDRRRILLAAQAATLLCAGALAALAFAGSAPVWLVFLLAALLAGASMLDSIARSSMVANLAGEWLRSAIAFNFGMSQVTAIVGPALGGLVIGATRVGAVYAIDALSVSITAFAALTIAPQRPPGGAVREPILTSVAAGLRYVRADSALLGSFAIDLVAMTFGMPRALFVVLSRTVFHAGAAGAGLLYASVSAGAAIAATALMGNIVLAAILLAVAGAADSVSAVCRTTIAQLVASEEMRGRMTSVFMLVVTGGARLGDIESGTVASLTTPSFAVLSGGLACLGGVGLVLVAFPALAHFDAHEHAYPLPLAAP
jgi:MFS family permease